MKDEFELLIDSGKKMKNGSVQYTAPESMKKISIVRSMRLKGCKYKEIAAELNVSVRDIGRWIEKHNDLVFQHRLHHADGTEVTNELELKYNS